jgi:hypothetical protein
MLCYTVLRRIEFENPATVERGNTISEFAITFDQRESYLSGTVADLATRSNN